MPAAAASRSTSCVASTVSRSRTGINHAPGSPTGSTPGRSAHASTAHSPTSETMMKAPNKSRHLSMSITQGLAPAVKKVLIRVVHPCGCFWTAPSLRRSGHQPGRAADLISPHSSSLPETRHDPTPACPRRLEPPTARSRADRFRRPPLFGHRRDRLSQTTPGIGSARANDPRLRPRTATGDHRRGRARSLPCRCDRDGPRLRPGRQGLGRLGPARRLALPDAGLGLARARAGRVGHALQAERPSAGQDARRGACTSSSATGRSWSTTTSTGCPRP